MCMVVSPMSLSFEILHPRDARGRFVSKGGGDSKSKDRRKRRKSTHKAVRKSVAHDFYSTSLPCIGSKRIFDAQGKMKGVTTSDGLNALLDADEDVRALYEIPSARDMMDKVVSSGDNGARASFQGGVLTECVFADYLARALHANDRYVNCERDSTAQYEDVIKAVTDRMPQALPRFIMQSEDGDTSVIQLGGPNATDCAIVRDGQIVACCEFKDKSAKAGEFDLLEDEDGKLVIDGRTRETIEEQMPSIIPIIEDFNDNDSTLNHIGRNVRLGEDMQRQMFHDYIKRGGIDAIMTFGDDDKPVLVDTHSDTLDECISTKGGEIRTAGRNHKAVFTPKRLERTLADSGVFHDDGDGTFRISAADAERNNLFVKKRGGTEVSRLKISNVFYVPIKSVTRDDDGTLTFKAAAVQQLKPTISAHLSCVKSQEEIRKMTIGTPAAQ